MTIRPCDEFIDCECSDNPFINTSAEAPDPNLFFARRYFPNIPSLNVDDSWYQRATCLGTCFSEESQQDADDCAQRDSQLCAWSVVQPPLVLLPDDPTAIPRSQIFGNAAVSCTSPCPVGPPFVFTVPANTFYGLTQQEADALAQSVCDYRALVFRMCSTIPPEPPVCDVTITSVMPPSQYQYAFEGESVAFGVTFDYTGMTNPTFLWLKDGIPYTQTQNPSLTFSPVLAMDEGLYRLAIIVPMCPTVFSPVFELIVCVPDVGPMAPQPVPGNDYWSFVTATSFGNFAVIESGDEHAPGPGENVDDLGGFPAAYYEAIYRGGGRIQNGPPDPMVDICTADAWSIRMEVGGVPDSTVLNVPYDPSLFATCQLAEDSIGGVGFGSGRIQTTDTAGGNIKTVGPAWPTGGVFTMVSCPFGRPTIELIQYVFTPQPDNLRIVDFDAFRDRVNVCPTCQNRLVGVEWDGTFRQDIYDFQTLKYIAGPMSVNPDDFKFKNKRASQVDIRIFNTDDNPPDFTGIWRLSIACLINDTDSVAIWVGKKETGNTPEGVYIFDESAPGFPVCVEQQVKCLTIEAF